VRYSLAQRVLITAVVGLPVAAFGLSVYRHIRDGDGADTYRNVYGWNIPLTVPATLAGALAVVAFAALLIRWWQLWRRSRLEGMSQVAKELRRND